jgi:predicted transcriptional regulator
VSDRPVIAKPLRLHDLLQSVYPLAMERLNITLDDEPAEKLARLAERMHIQPGTIARSLLSSALDDADPDARNIVELLDGLPSAYERAQLGLQQAKAGETVALDDL